MDEEERVREEEEDKERERQLIEEREKQEALDRDYQKRLEEEERNLASMRKIQDEMSQLNSSLNSCINIAAASIANISIRKRCDYLRTDNINAYQKANRTVDNAVDETKKNISRIQDAKEEVQQEAKSITEQLVEHQEQMKEKREIQRLSEA